MKTKYDIMDDIMNVHDIKVAQGMGKYDIMYDGMVF
jgi:hypothetical protein